MNWDNVIAGALKDIDAEYKDVKNGHLCRATQPMQCRMVWQVIRTNPTNGENVELCWGHARKWDEYYDSPRMG